MVYAGDVMSAAMLVMTGAAGIASSAQELAWIIKVNIELAGLRFAAASVALAVM